MPGEAKAAAGERDYRIAARLERLPIARWHLRMRLIVGTGLFFDAFDILVIGYAIPSLISLWGLTPSQIGLLIAIGSAGQIIGAPFFGWLAEKFGRIPAIVTTIAIYSIMSLACAFAWNLQSLLVLRFVQGMGLGGEAPVTNTYISEFAKAERRARFTLIFQLLFPAGSLAAAAAGSLVVPHFGWQAIFLVGAIPALVAMPLRWLVPESPRWLASKGRYAEADRVLSTIEDDISEHGTKPLPPLPAQLPETPRSETHIADLFRGIYLRRTLVVWALYIGVNFITSTLYGWLPSIYRTVYHVPVDQALHYGFITQAANLVGVTVVAFFIDRTGRRPWFVGAFILGSLPLFALWDAHNMDPSHVVIFVSMAAVCVGSVSIALGMYTAESYPTNMRALGSGVVSVVARGASITGPLVIGAVLTDAGLGTAFVLIAFAPFLAAIVVFFFATETKGKTLEVLSPPLDAPPPQIDLSRETI